MLRSAVFRWAPRSRVCMTTLIFWRKWGQTVFLSVLRSTVCEAKVSDLLGESLAPRSIKYLCVAVKISTKAWAELCPSVIKRMSSAECGEWHPLAGL